MERVFLKDRELPGDIIKYISNLEEVNNSLKIRSVSLKEKNFSLKSEAILLEENNRLLETKTVLLQEEIEVVYN